MGRRIFEEKNFNIFGKVLPYSEFKPFINRDGGFAINEEQKPRLIKEAEKMLDREIPQLYAHEYMMFRRDGNRSVFESRYFPRRAMLLALALGEYVERQGRFTDKLIDVLWLILEETTWVLPAHNPTKAGVNCCLPYAYNGEVDYIDLFAATTAADLAWVYYLCRDILDEVTTIISERILAELDRRIIKPFLNESHMWNKCWWTGMHGNSVNNWAPWIISNILTVTAFTVKDTTDRAVVIRRALPVLDNFTSVYHPAGGCDEGPSYWNAAGGALFNACLVLYDMTGGYINVFDDPLMKNMGEYAVKVIITKNRALNFADSPSKVRPDPMLIYQWGEACGSDMMKEYAMWSLDGQLSGVIADTSMPYRWMGFLCSPRLPKAEFVPPKHLYIGGLEVAISREENALAKGLYVALKGGNNAESHNHNDLGNIIVFSDDNPIFLDAGSGKYTKRTFSKDRYTIWAMCSDYHNCATFGGVAQREGSAYCSRDTVYDPETGKMTLDLTAAYPPEAKLAAYKRSAVLENSTVTVTDEITLSEAGSVAFSFITRVIPESVTDSSFVIEGREVTFDPSLVYYIEQLDKTEPEVATIPSGWDTEVLYRITLTSKTPVKDKTYVLTVK